MDNIDGDELLKPKYLDEFKDTAVWFPGHMAKALRHIKEKAKHVDMVLEVRDARVPLASGNSSIHAILGEKPRLIVFNKADLADRENIKVWKKWFLDVKVPFVFINALKLQSLNQVKYIAERMMKKRWRALENKGIRRPPLRMMALGIPNTGKSTIINRLTKRKALRVGNRPGVTRSQDWVVMGKDMELLDTPGVMPPKIETAEQGMWLSVIHAVKDDILGQTQIARFITERLAEKQSPQFQNKYSLDSLDSSAAELVMEIGKKLNFKKKKGKIDINKTSALILRDFRQGLLGTFCFERPH